MGMFTWLVNKRHPVSSKQARYYAHTHRAATCNMAAHANSNATETVLQLRSQMGGRRV